jgi:hypothetical protein
MNREAKWVGAVIVALCGAATAHAQTYTLDFFDSSSTSIIDATGAFTYNAAQPTGSQFSNFTVDWFGAGAAFNFTAAANSAPAQSCGSGSISFFSYLTSPACSSQGTSWLGEYSFGTSTATFIISPLGGPVSSSVGTSALLFPETGSFSATETVVVTPEIDPASAASGLTLLLGGLMVLRGRKQRRLAA